MNKIITFWLIIWHGNIFGVYSILNLKFNLYKVVLKSFPCQILNQKVIILFIIKFRFFILSQRHLTTSLSSSHSLSWLYLIHHLPDHETCDGLMKLLTLLAGSFPHCTPRTGLIPSIQEPLPHHILPDPDNRYYGDTHALGYQGFGRFLYRDQLFQSVTGYPEIEDKKKVCCVRIICLETSQNISDWLLIELNE